MKDARQEDYANNGNYVVKKTKKHSIFAFIVCLFIALTIWIYTKNADIKLGNDSDDLSSSNSVTSYETVSEQ